MLDYSTSALCVSMVVLIKKTKKSKKNQNTNAYLPTLFFSAGNLKHTYFFIWPYGKMFKYEYNEIWGKC
jgi:hypothetical protein